MLYGLYFYNRRTGYMELESSYPDLATVERRIRIAVKVAGQDVRSVAFAIVGCHIGAFLQYRFACAYPVDDLR